MALLQLVVNVLANVLSVLTFMSPIPSLYQSWRARDLGELSFVPFAAMLVNSFVWLVYGLLSGSIFPLFSTMVVCEALSVAFIAVYLFLSPRKARCVKILAVAIAFIVLVCVYMALGLSGVTGQSRDGTATVVGVIADVGSLAMYSSPFETIVRVVRTKDARSMPIHLCLVGAIGNSVWVVYAVLTNDVIVLIPNVICSTVGWIQVVVWWIFRPGRAAWEPADGRTKAISSPAASFSVVVETPKPTKAPSAVV